MQRSHGEAGPPGEVFNAPVDRVAALLEKGMGGEGESTSPARGGGGAGDESPRHVPGYQISGKLGEGGMGTVWRAVQLGTRREVALKLMHVSRSGVERARARFDREVQIASRLEHPHIARVYDSGVHQGAYYYAMELVEPSLHLDEYVTRKKLPRRQILELMLLVCRAVAYAHQNGVIHRDLKPANILVTDDGRPKVVDFGLARMLADDDSHMTVTREGEVAGTPAYMSPEQAAGQVERLDTRTDVYSLGATLFALLTGQHPHDQDGPRHAVIARIINEDVRRPRQVNRELDADINSLLLKSLSKDAEARYASAAGLAADLDNYLKGDPLTARHATLWYFARKRLRRRWASVLTVVVTVTSVVGLGAWFYGREVRQRNLAQAYAREAELQRVTSLITDSRSRFDEDKRLRLTAGYLSWRAGIVPGSGAAAGGAGDKLAPDGVAGDYRCAAVMRGEMFVAGTDDGILRVWGSESGRLSHSFEGFGSVRRVAASSDGRWVAAACLPKSIFLVDVTRGTTTAMWSAFQGEVVAMAFSPDGRFLLVGTDDEAQGVCLLGVDGRPVRTFAGRGGATTAVAFTADGQHVLIASGRSASPGAAVTPGVALWDLKGTAPVWRHASEPTIRHISSSPDGGLIVASSLTASIVYDGGTGKIQHARVFDLSGRGHIDLSPRDIQIVETNWQK